MTTEFREIIILTGTQIFVSAIFTACKLYTKLWEPENSYSRASPVTVTLVKEPSNCSLVAHSRDAHLGPLLHAQTGDTAPLFRAAKQTPPTLIQGANGEQPSNPYMQRYRTYSSTHHLLIFNQLLRQSLFIEEYCATLVSGCRLSFTSISLPMIEFKNSIASYTCITFSGLKMSPKKL